MAPHKAAGAGRPQLKGRYLPLDGAGLDLYAETVSRLVLRARLNKFYPDPFACADRIRFLGATLRQGVYGGVYLDRTSGLPRLRDVLTVQVDRQIAPEFLLQHEARLGSGRLVTPRVGAKIEYYRKLVRTYMPPLHSLEVRLRRVYPERNMAAFQVVFDRFDAAEAVFARYTLLLEQTDRMWGGGLLERSGDYTRQTGTFRDKMERIAQDESEIMFLILGRSGEVRIEEVTRGRIGPVWTPWTPAPAGWFPADASRAFVLHCPLDQASIAQENDVDNDPFSTFYKEFLSDAGRSVVSEAAAELGYRVHKERKFACTPEAAATLNAKLREACTKNVVYSL